MEFRILGPTEVADGERILLGGTGKPTALLARLLLSRNEIVSADRLVDDLWGERPPRTAQKSLQTYVSQLRRVLGDGAVATRAPGYVLPVAADDLDAARFERLVADGRAALGRGEPAAAAATLREALALWRGAALAGFAHEPWAQAEAERLEESRLQALEGRLDADLAAGRHADIAPELEALVATHPLREHMLELLMLALYRCGRQADALGAYRAGRRRLSDELGLEPMPELRELEQRILRHDPALAPPASAVPAPAPLPTPRRHRRPAVALVAAIVVIGVAVGTGAGLLVTGGGSSGSQPAAANSLVLVSADGRLGTQLPVGLAPAHAIGAAGAIWTSNERDESVSRVDAGARTVEMIPVGNSPQALAFAGGYVWVAEAGEARVAAIDPRARKVVFAVTVGNGPTGLAARGRELWVANSVDGTLTTIDARSTRVLRTVAVGSQPSAVAASPGAVWVALAGSGSVVELDRSGRSVLESVNVGDDPVALAVDGSNVWVANRQDGTVSRIDPAGTVDATVRVGGAPTSLSAANGTVWATLADGGVARIDARSARLLRTVAVGGSPAAAVALGDEAWIATLDATAAHRGGTLRVELDDLFDCECTDTIGADPDGWPILGLAYDGLVAYRHVGGPAGAALVPDLAQAVPRPGDGGRTYVFRLRPGVRFSNGEPVRASDVAASFRRLFAVKHLDVWDVPLYTHITGVRSCAPGGGCDLGSGIVADDAAGTVTFHLDTPDPDFLYQLTLPFAFVVPASTPQRLARRMLPGTGPYRVESWRPGAGAMTGRLVLVRNPRFRPFAPDAQPAGYPDRIVVTVGAAVARQIGAVVHGASDVITSPFLPRETIQRLAARHAAQLHADSPGLTEYLFLNTTVPPFDVPAARRAVNEAIDRNRIVQLLGGPVAALPTCQILPPDFPGYKPYCPYGLDPSSAGTWSGPNLQRALQLVRASGTRGERIRVWGLADHEAVATYLSGLLRLLGYRVTTRVVTDSHAYYAQIGDPATRAQIGWAGWGKDYTSAADFLQPLFSCSGIVAGDPSATSNYSRLCDHSLDARIAAAGRLQQLDPVAGQQAWAAIDHAIVDDAAAVPYVNDLTVTLLSPRTGDYQFNPQSGVLLDQLWVR